MGEEVIKGGCNCGQIRYALDSPPIAVAICHCTRCRRQSGSAFSVNLVAKARTVSIEGELAHYDDPESDSGNPVRREFCGNCGSPIRSIPTAQPAIVAIKAGTLDNPSAFSPTLQMYTCSSLSWIDLPEAMPSFDRGPTA